MGKMSRKKSDVTQIFSGQAAMNKKSEKQKFKQKQDLKKKSRIRETKHLSTDADSSTDDIGGWTKNTQKPDCFEKRKKSPKTQKLKNV